MILAALLAVGLVVGLRGYYRWLIAWLDKLAGKKLYIPAFFITR